MDILMPQLGETVAEGKITAWYKDTGDSVTAGDRLFEIETDKTSMEVPSTIAGMIREIRVAAGRTVPVGTVVAVIEAARSAEDPFHAVRTPTENFGPATRADGVQVTPLARRLAAQSGVDTNALMGSGPGGRIVGSDINGLANSPVARRSATADSLPPVASAEQIKKLYTGVPYKEVQLDGMRRAIARRMLAAAHNIPHFYLSVDVGMDTLAAVRGEANAEARGAFKLSITDFVIKALAIALQQVPEANAVWAVDRLLRFEHSDIAIAVAVDGGLYTPIIRSAERKSLSAISVEMKNLTERAHNRLLTAADFEGGTISVSNLGMYGVRTFSAIINPPQAAILAVGAVERKPLELPGGTIGFGGVMSASLSCDHRIIDGALGARLLAAFKALMESPRQLLD